MLVFNQGGPALPGFERVLIVCDRSSLLRCQRRSVAACGLVQLPAGSAQYFLIANCYRFKITGFLFRHVALQILLKNGTG